MKIILKKDVQDEKHHRPENNHYGSEYSRDKPILEYGEWARRNGAIIVWMQVGKGAIQTDSRPPCDTIPSDNAHLYVNRRIELRNAHTEVAALVAWLSLCIAEYLNNQ